MKTTRLRFFALLLFTAPAWAGRLDTQMGKAGKLLADGKLDDAIAILHPLAADTTLPAEDRFTVYERIASAQSQVHKYPDALATTDQMLAAFTTRPELLVQTYQFRADIFRNTNQPDKELDALDHVVANAGDDTETAIAARFRALQFLQQQNKRAPQLYDLAAQTLPLLQDDPRAAIPLWYMSDAAWTQQKYDLALDAAQKLIAGYPAADPVRSHTAHSRVLDCLHKLNREADLRATCAAWEQSDPDPAFHNQAAYEMANSFLAEKKSAEALAAFRRVISAHAAEGVSNFWPESQSAIVDLLTAQGDYKGALQEAHIALDTAKPNAVALSINHIVDLFNKADSNRTRANQFVNFQIFGPAGPDGKLRTADDLTNPLDAVGYPDDPVRRAAITTAFPLLGTDAAGIYHRGMLCLYSGQPKAALYYFKLAFERADTSEFGEFGATLIINGLRPAQGNSLGLPSAIQYVLYGPKGKTGAENLPDPFAPYAAYTPPPPFNLTPLSDADTQTLRALQANLQAGASDPTWPILTRQKTFAALARVNESLNDWPAQAPWYLALLTHYPEPKIRQTIINGAYAANKGDVPHLGNVRAFAASLSTLAADPDTAAAREFTNAPALLQKSLLDLERLAKQPNPRLKPRN